MNHKEIRIVNILESEGNQTEPDNKFNRVDLMIEDSHYRKIIVEIQNSRESDYLERLLYGAFKVVVEHQKLDENFKNSQRGDFHQRLPQ